MYVKYSSNVPGIASEPLDALPTPVTAEEAYEEAKAVMRRVSLTSRF